MGFRFKALRRKGGLALLALTAGLAGCTGEAEPPVSTPDVTQAPIASSPAADVIAVIGGKPIYRSEFLDRLLAGYGNEVLREMLLQEAVGMEAASLGITVTDQELDREIGRMSAGYESEAAFYRSMKEQLGMDRQAVREEAKYRLLLEKLATKDVQISETEIRNYYNEHRQEYGPRKQMEIAWILMESREEARQVLQMLADGADFRVLAARYSMDEMTAADGGNLGWIEEGDPFYDARLLAAANELEAGEATGPIELDEGYAVIQLIGVKKIQERPLDAVREEIRMQLALERAVPLGQLERELLAKYGARVLDSRLSLE
jgi:foldase protein PrsA